MAGEVGVEFEKERDGGDVGGVVDADEEDVVGGGFEARGEVERGGFGAAGEFADARAVEPDFRGAIGRAEEDGFEERGRRGEFAADEEGLVGARVGGGDPRGHGRGVDDLRAGEGRGDEARDEEEEKMVEGAWFHGSGVINAAGGGDGKWGSAVGKGSFRRIMEHKIMEWLRLGRTEFNAEARRAQRKNSAAASAFSSALSALKFSLGKMRDAD